MQSRILALTFGSVFPKILSFGAAVLVAVVAPTLGQPAATPSLTEILLRAARFVDAYTARTTGMVLEESYVQDVQQLNRFGFRVNMRSGATHRTLKSDLLLVRPGSDDVWMQFRDVFEVDGRSRRDRSDRLQKLFLQPSKSTAARAEDIMKESARYNIGDVERTINLPLLGLMMLDRRVQPGFQFRIDDTSDLPGDVMTLPKTVEFTPPAGAIAVAFKETQVQTMVRTPQGKNLPVQGRFWFAPSTGHVVLTEVRVDDWTLAAAVHVAYGIQNNIELPLPVAMHEIYENRLNSRRIEGSATYSNVREFNVKVDEQIAPDR